MSLSSNVSRHYHDQHNFIYSYVWFIYSYVWFIYSYVWFLYSYVRIIYSYVWLLSSDISNIQIRMIIDMKYVYNYCTCLLHFNLVKSC